MIENEDLRDRITLLGKGDDFGNGVSIDYLPYLAPRLLEKSISKV